MNNKSESLKEYIQRYCEENNKSIKSFCKDISMPYRTFFTDKDRPFTFNGLILMYSLFKDVEAYKCEVSYRLKNTFNMRKESFANIKKLSNDDCIKILEIMMNAGVFDND